MNTFLLVTGGVLIFAIGSYFFSPIREKKVLTHIGILFSTLCLGTLLIFSHMIGNRVLANYEFDGKIEKYIAEDFVAEKFGVISLYSWYEFRNLQPAITIKVQENYKKREITVNAFTGKIIKSSLAVLPEEKNITFTAWNKERAQTEKIAEKETTSIVIEQQREEERQPLEFEQIEFEQNQEETKESAEEEEKQKRIADQAEAEALEKIKNMEKKIAADAARKQKKEESEREEKKRLGLLTAENVKNQRIAAREQKKQAEQEAARLAELQAEQEQKRLAQIAADQEKERQKAAEKAAQEQQAKAEAKAKKQAELLAQQKKAQQAAAKRAAQIRSRAS